MLKLKYVESFKKGVTSASSSSQAPGFDREPVRERPGHQTFPPYQDTSITAWKALRDNKSPI